MEFPKSPDRSLCLLILGLLILISSGLFSLFALVKLEESYVQRKRSGEARDSYELLSKQIKDWTIYSLVFNEFDPLKINSKAVILRDDIERSVRDIFYYSNLSDAKAPIHPYLIEDISILLNSKKGVLVEQISKIDSELTEMSQFEQDWVTRSGSEMTLYINNLMVASGVSLSIAVFLIIVSFSLKRRDELEKNKVIETLTLLRAKSEYASQEKSRFLSTVSHEIRTPLNGIIGIADVLAHSALSARDTMLVKTINQSGKTLLRIINDILDFSKVDAGKMDFVENEFFIEDIIKFVLLNLSAKAEEKNIELRGEIGKGVPKKIWADSERLTQVLFNIIGNAIKFSDHGCVFVKVEFKQWSRGKVVLMFSVTDDGIGIEMKDLKTLFEPFVQIRRTGTSGEVGTGLGLSISRGIIKAMGSDINLVSTPGDGSTFYFELEFAQFSTEVFEESLLVTSSVKVVPLIEQEKIKKVYEPSILVVDDNPTNQIVAQSMLKRLGLKALLANNGIEAIDFFKKHDVDLILMDCQMPVLNGFDATRRIRALGSRVPIVAITANAFSSDREMCLAAGMNDFIPKPVEFSVLREKLLKLLPAERSLSAASLFHLDSSIGLSNRKKVVDAFQSTVQSFKESYRNALERSDLDELKRLGHRYKGSAWTVGGIAFGQKCLKLENCKSLASARKLEPELLASLLSLEENLNHANIQQIDA